MSRRLLDTIRAEIDERGPIGFDRYMELALYGPGGFYERPPIGPEGHFVTSPHVHAVFGQLLGAAVLDLWERLERPKPFLLAEPGAGDGTLARSLLGALAEVEVRYVAVERSPGARTALAGIAGVEVAEALPPGTHLVLANELLDNLPFRRVRGSNEIRIGWDGERLVEVAVEPDDGLLALMPEGLEAGEETVVPTGALAFVEEVAARLAHPGYVLLIDYGAVGEPGGPPHGYRSQQIAWNVLDDPGDADITAGVDFALMAERAERADLIAWPSVTQRSALVALGFEGWVRDELAHQAELLRTERGADAARAWSGRSRATLLVDPTALGRLRWLLLGTEGATMPSWIM